MKIAINRAVMNYCLITISTVFISNPFAVSHPSHCSGSLEIDRTLRNNLPFLGISLAPVGDTLCSEDPSVLDNNEVDWLLPDSAVASKPQQSLNNSNEPVGKQQLTE